MLLNLGDHVDLLDSRSTLGNDSDRVVDLRQPLGEFDVDNRTDDLNNLPGPLCCCCLCHNSVLKAPRAKVGGLRRRGA